jgi:integrase
MVKIRLPYVERSSAKGKNYYYYRRAGRRIALPPDQHGRYFADAYHRIHASFESEGKPRPPADSVTILVDDYLRSPVFGQLSKTTQRNYRTHLKTIDELYGWMPVQAISRKIVKAYQAAMVRKAGETSDHPARANYAVEVLRRLISFAIDHGVAMQNPAARPGRLKIGERRAWTDEEIESFCGHAPPHLVLALRLALFSGQRQGDLLSMSWAQWDERGNSLAVRQEKTGVMVTIPVHRALLADLHTARERRAAVTIITNARGAPYGKDVFRHEFSDAVKSAGLNGVVFHGLRHNATQRLMEAGCTEGEAKAITGHKTSRMIQHYAARANQKKLAGRAMRKLESDETAKQVIHKLPNRAKPGGNSITTGWKPVG